MILSSTVLCSTQRTSASKWTCWAFACDSVKKNFYQLNPSIPGDSRSTTTPQRRIEPKKYEGNIGRDLDAKGITDPKQRQRITQGYWIQFTRSNRVGDEMGFQFDTNRSGVYGGSGSLSGLATVATHTPGVKLVEAFYIGLCLPIFTPSGNLSHYCKVLNLISCS